MSSNIDRSLLFTLASAIVAAGSITAASVVYFYENYKIPLKQLEAKIENKDMEESFKTSQKANQTLTEKNSNLTSKLAGLELQIEKKESRIQELEKAYLFYPNSLYPLGFGTVKVGEHIDKLRSVFREEDLTWKESMDGDSQVGVKPSGNFFTGITYTYDAKTKDIISIAFDSNYTAGDYLLGKLSEIGGPPTKSKRGGAYRWKITGRVSSYLLTPNVYMIMADKYVPIIWKDPD